MHTFLLRTLFRRFVTLLLAVLPMLGLPVRAANFTAGNLAVLRAGDGVQLLANTGNTMFIDEYTPTGTFVQSIAVPDSGAAALIVSGSANSEGGLMRSPNGRWLAFVGYNTNRPTAVSLSGIASAVVPRGIGTLDAAGNYALAAVTMSQFSANNIRSSATDGTNSFWGAGGNSGTYYFGRASAAAAVQTTNQANTRVNQIHNGNLYFSTGSGTRGIYGYAGTPTASAMTNFFVGTGATSSPYGFAINPAGTILYVADDTASAAGGIQRWNFSGGVWSLAYTLGTGVANVGARGLVVDWSGANPILYATSAEAAVNRLLSIVDAGAGSTATSLATNGTNRIFRGLAFAPLAAPSITSQPQSITTNSGSTVNFSATAAGHGALGYQWRKNGGSLASQTASALTLSNVTAGDAGNYDVVVTNSVYAVTSAVAVLVISGTPPSITTPPAGATVECTSNFTFNVMATGDVPLCYQWRRNGVDLTDATNAAFSLPSVSVDQAGSYAVVITNTSGSITSSPSALTVQDTFPPVFTLLGANPLSLQIHTAFSDPGATATDGCAGNLTGSINASGAIDVDTLGTYLRTYTVTDGYNSVTNTRTVNVVDELPPVLILPANIFVLRTNVSGNVAFFTASATNASGSNVPVTCVPTSGSVFTQGVTTVTCLADDGLGHTNSGTFTVTVASVNIVVNSNSYAPYYTDLQPGAPVYVDADPVAGSPVRATQRALGYREVDYKSLVFGTFGFSAVAPSTNGANVNYDYTTQGSKTATVGAWVDKNVPIIIGPDGLAYITDGHHTTAGYLASNSPVRAFVPGANRVIIGHVVTNYFNPLAGPQPVDDTWWFARAAENNAFLYGTNGNQLTLSGEPNYANLQPVLPSVVPMPGTPSTIGSDAMLHSASRGLMWGLADGVVKSGTDAGGTKIVGFKKSAPGTSVDINFVEFYWADFLRNRILWDDSKVGSPYGSTNGDANIVSAPLSFFAAVANGIALAKSEAYRDQYGRSLRDYTNSALFTPNTVNWANGSFSNGLATAGSTFNLYLLDDSTIAGDIIPSALTTNILHIDTTSGLTVANTASNLSRLLINAGWTLLTTWKDTTVSNTVLALPSGSGEVTLTGIASVSESTTISNGAFIVNGTLNGGGSVNVWGGSLRGNGSINGAVSILASAVLAPGSSIGTLTINGPLTLAAFTDMEISKSGGVLTNDLINGITTLTYGGTLTVTATGDALAAGDTFVLFTASSYVGGFATLNLPSLPAGLVWNTANLASNGSIAVTFAPAVVTITDPSFASVSVGGGTVSYNVSGTALNAVGTMTWSNSLTGASGTLAAASSWTIPSIALAVGTNNVTVTATNAAGIAAVASVAITRATLVTAFTTPHLDNIPGAVTNVLGATTFINHGLVGVGHISASALDSFGESFGSMSGMQITGFATNADGSYSGTLNVLPDRGYNSGAFYADYAARINQVGFTFRPYYGATNIGGTTDLEKLDAQTNQFSFGSISGVKFTYFDPITGSNSFTTGLDPGTNSTTLFGKTMPYVKSYRGVPFPGSTSTNTYAGISKLPLDSEALILKPDGSGYVGDEYGESIYYFNPAKQIIGAILPPQASLPHSPSNVINFTSVTTPVNGRRNNQGFEGVSLSPDGTRLFALQQSASVQDADAANNHRAKNTRLYIYDVSGSPTPGSPLAVYALTLPIYKQNGNGAASDRTCAQSEIVALDNTRFLVLSRDGNGLGSAVTNPSVYKTILLVDTTVGSPLNIAGDAARNAEGGRITTASGVLDPSITPLSWIETVNLLNTNQLAKFNVLWDSGTNQVTKLTMGEKWEGLALVSANDPANPNDYFLFVGNDNDFITSAGQMRGPDGTNVSYNAFDGYPTNRVPAPLDSANSESDTRLLAYRVTITPSTAPVAPAQQVVIAVTNRVYLPYRTDLSASTYVYVDADIAAGSPVRATQRALGYREVDYKSRVPGTLFFSAATPTTNMGVITYDYSAQAAKTNQVGFWVDKDVPIIIGPDGNAYITDGHHTTAGYLSTNAPVRQFVPGLNRVILGHIVANYYNPLNPQAADDAWWTARASENNAYIYGLNGNALTQPGEPNYANLQPVLPSVQPMPNTPSAVGAGAMLNSVERSLAWGLADGILKSSLDRAGAKIVGYKKSAPGSSVDINFVEFYWADFLRNRIVWNNALAGSPFGSPNGDASVTAAPLSFFAAVANGIALAKSEVYRDQYGRLLRDYTNSALYAANTVNWAKGSSSNGFAAPSNTFNLFLRDDSTIIGDITPTALATATNILRISTTAGMTVTNTISNITKLFINGGTRIATTWKDATVTNTTLTFPGGAGDVTLSGTASVSESTTVSNGAFIVNGALNGGSSVTVWGGLLRGTGVVNGAVSVAANGFLAPGSRINPLTINGPLTLAGTTALEIDKTGATLTSERVTGVTMLNYGGTLTVTASGDALTAGDSFQLFTAGGYGGAFTTLNLPVLNAGLFWNTSGLLTTGTITVNAAAPANLSGAGYTPGGGFQLQLAGSAGAQYEIQLNTNLNTTNWTTITVLTNTAGTSLFSDLAATNSSQRFYRAIAR